MWGCLTKTGVRMRRRRKREPISHKGMVHLFEINLESPPSPKGYPSGSKVIGTVVVESGEDKNYQLIEVSLEGTGKVSWTTGSGENSHTHTAKQSYLTESVTVWSDEGHGRILTAGHHEFPFAFSIPNTCPSSYQDKMNAWIRYVVKGRITNKSMLKLDHSVEKQIAVVKEVCLDHTTAEPVRKEKDTTEGCFCCLSGPIVLTAELPRSGFVVGDRIPLSVFFENGSTSSLRIGASLIRKVQYKAGRAKTKRSHTEVQEYSNYFDGRSTATWPPETLIVPDVLTTVKTPEGMISISYEVKVQVSLGVLQTLEVSIPVTIGDVPFCSNN